MLRGGPALRYFLDTEYNGWRGALLSLALVPEDGGDEFYVTVDWTGSIEPWVEQHVIPYLDMVPESLMSPRLSLEAALVHRSHATLFNSRQNPGMDSVGLRLSFRL